jgi:predicted CoA-binding protein
MDVLECYRKAEECLERARRAPTQVYQVAWYKMAASWTEQAERMMEGRAKRRRESSTAFRDNQRQNGSADSNGG